MLCVKRQERGRGIPERKCPMRPSEMTCPARLASGPFLLVGSVVCLVGKRCRGYPGACVYQKRGVEYVDADVPYFACRLLSRIFLVFALPSPSVFIVLWCSSSVLYSPIWRPIGREPQMAAVVHKLVTDYSRLQTTAKFRFSSHIASRRPVV